MYIHNHVIENIPGVAEICAAEEAWQEHESKNPNQAGKSLNIEVVGKPEPDPNDPFAFCGEDDLYDPMTVEETKEYLAWWDTSVALYKALQQTIADNPYAQQAILLDLTSRTKPTEGSARAIKRLNAGDDYRAVLDEYEADPGKPIGDI